MVLESMRCESAGWERSCTKILKLIAGRAPGGRMWAHALGSNGGGEDIYYYKVLTPRQVGTDSKSQQLIAIGTGRPV